MTVHHPPRDGYPHHLHGNGLCPCDPEVRLTFDGHTEVLHRDMTGEDFLFPGGATCPPQLSGRTIAVLLALTIGGILLLLFTLTN